MEMNSPRLATLQSPGCPVGAESREILELGPWFHNLHLPEGVQTAADHPLGDFPRCKWSQLGPCLPEDMTGMRALDIGCNAGFYSFELAARGAEVVGIDHDDHYLRQAEWAKQKMPHGHRITFRRLKVYELHQLKDSFDLVLFMGVFYHLRYPLLALDIVAEHAKGLLVFQSLTLRDEERELQAPEVPFEAMETLNDPAWPRMAFIEHELAGDATNWWVPNHAAVEAVLRSSGFDVLQRPGHELFVCRRSDNFETARAGVREELRSAIGTRP